jgi:ribosome recycling factor
MVDTIISTAEKQMQKALESLKHELSRMRTGRANPSLLEHIMVDYYGTPTSMSQVANINVADARTLVVTPWEKSMVPAIEKAIYTADLGLSPVTAGEVIRVPLPPLTEERRREFVRLLKSVVEQARVSIREARRGANNQFKSLVKDKSITEDDERKGHDRIQKLTDKYISDADAVFSAKETDIMEI